jgi:hypothetical protein
MRNRIKIKIKKICSTGFGKSEFYFGKGEAIVIVKKKKKTQSMLSQTEHEKKKAKKKSCIFFCDLTEKICTKKKVAGN